MFTNKNGFTLIELAVTITVVGIMSSMSLAQYNLYREKTNDLAAVSQLIQARTSFEALIADNVGNTNYNLFFAYGYGMSTTDELVSHKQSLSDGSVEWWDQPLPGYAHDNKVMLMACGNSSVYMLQTTHEDGSNKIIDTGRGSQKRTRNNLYFSGSSNGTQIPGAGKIISYIYEDPRPEILTCPIGAPAMPPHP